MNQRTPNTGYTTSQLISVEVIARLAIRHLTDEQLLELLTRLECELVRRTSPLEDQLLSEYPVDA